VLVSLGSLGSFGIIGPNNLRSAAKREGEDKITEREVTVLLAEFATVWNELFPAEQARIVQLLLERVDVQEDALELRMRPEGLASLVAELRRDAKRLAA
jgi:site-specific DNA recombinase